MKRKKVSASLGQAIIEYLIATLSLVLIIYFSGLPEKLGRLYEKRLRHAKVHFYKPIP